MACIKSIESIGPKTKKPKPQTEQQGQAAFLASGNIITPADFVKSGQVFGYAGGSVFTQENNAV